MDIVIQNIFLPSKNKSLAFRFMTAVFDTEIFMDHQKIEYTSLGGVNIYFLETNDPLPLNHGPFFSLGVKHAEDLMNIKQKVEFFCYREGIDKLSMQESADTLKIFDVDDNVWQINHY